MPDQEQKIVVVVVDDDQGMNLALRRLLNAAGLQALTFPSAEALLQSGAAATAACFILDVHLPGLSGFELQQRLAQSGTACPVVFITAFDDADFIIQAEAAGAVAWFTKPFSGRQLVAVVKQALGLGLAEPKPNQT